MTVGTDESWVPRAAKVYDATRQEWISRPVRYHDDAQLQWRTGGLRASTLTDFPTVATIPSSKVREGFGVNAHLMWQWTPYVSNSDTEDATYQTMLDLGVSYFREGYTVVGGDTQQNRMIPRLLAAGLKYYAGLFTYSLTAAETSAVIDDLLTRYPDPASFEAFAGVNEPDDTGVDWHAHTVEIQQTIWNAIRSRPAFNNVPIVSPALRLTRLTEIPESAPYFNTIAIHHYPVAGKSFINASTQNQPLDYKVDTYAATFPGKTISVDEYGTVTSTATYPNTSSSSVPEEVTAVYHPRAVCEAARRGIRVCMYELLDRADLPAEFGSYFGLVDTMAPNGLTDPSVWRKKPSFNSLARLIALTRDDGPAFTPVPLQATVSGTPNTLALSRRSGEHGILHWRDDLIYDGSTKQMIVVPPVNQTVTFPTARTVTLTDVTSGTVTALGSVRSYTVAVGANVIHAAIGSTGAVPYIRVNAVSKTVGSAQLAAAASGTVDAVSTVTGSTVGPSSGLGASPLGTAPLGS